MKIVSICAEQAPWARTGGLGDVTAALPAALLDVDPSLEHITVLPLYGCCRPKLAGRLKPAGPFQELVDDAPYRTLFLEDPLFETEGLYDGPQDKFGLLEHQSETCEAAF